nr:DUF2264 domain-containing protein [Lactiplantibacillus pentosus]
MQQMIPHDFDYLQQSGGSYLPEIRRFEALLRPLWGILPAYFSGDVDLKYDNYINGLVDLVNNEKLPEISTNNRQIAVELGVIGYALGTYKEKFIGLFSKSGQEYLVNWLLQINRIEFPKGNWYWFLVLINAALKDNGLSYSEKKLATALTTIDSFYQGDGWYFDGNNKQADYYVAFAFNFYSLLYARMENLPKDSKYYLRPVAFANDFVDWFDDSGRSIPFGRSLTYRFAHVAFWSALVVTGAYQQTPLSLGQIKGIIQRNIDFWKRQPIVLPKAHNLSIGYGYNDLLMSEDYNAPGSPMWAFKTFVILELSENDVFWKIDSEPLQLPETVNQKHSGFQISRSKQQVTALSSLQYCGNPLLYHQVEKYSKFAYSTNFGFNITRDVTDIQQYAVDSTLAISVAGHEQFTSRSVIDQTKFYSAYNVSFWQLWNKQVEVATYLIPISAELHIRIHELSNKLSIDTYEGGFPLHNWNRKYNEFYDLDCGVGVVNENGNCVISDLTHQRTGKVVTQGPNTNIYSAEKNVVPTLYAQLPVGHHVLACVVEGTTDGDINLPNVELEINDADFKLHVNDDVLVVARETV